MAKTEPRQAIVELRTMEVAAKRAQVRAAAPAARLAGALSALAAPDLVIEAVRFERLSDALAENSLRALIADAECFASFCIERRSVGLPASITTLTGYLDHLEATHRKVATVRRRLASINKLHALAGLKAPTGDIAVQSAFKALRRRQGTAQRQAAPLRFTAPQRERKEGRARFSVGLLLQACGDDIRGRRDAALLSLAYDGGLRSAELVGVQAEHIESGEGEDGSGTLYVPHSKTDQDGEGAYVWLSPFTMVRVASWIRDSGISSGPLFRRIVVNERHAREARRALTITDLAPNARVDRQRMRARPAEAARIRYTIGTRALSTRAISIIIRRVAGEAVDQGLLKIAQRDFDATVAALSSHSFRVGLTQDLFAAGEDVGPVAQALRWRSTSTALRYARKLAPDSGASARVLRKIRGL